MAKLLRLSIAILIIFTFAFVYAGDKPYKERKKRPDTIIVNGKIFYRISGKRKAVKPPAEILNRAYAQEAYFQQ